MRIRHRFERCERLGADDEQGLFSIQVPRGLDEVGAIHIRDEAKREIALGVILERLVCHHGTQIGAADTDVNYIANRLARMPFPVAAANLGGKRSHPGEHCMDFGNYILAIEQDLFALWSPQGHVQNGPPLGDVDLFTCEHGLDVPAKTGLFRKLNEKTDRLAGDPVLRVVEVQIEGFQREVPAALWIFSEKLLEI